MTRFATPFLPVLGVLITAGISRCGELYEVFPDDVLTPYSKHERTRRSLRFIRECQPTVFGNLTHEEFQASTKLPSGKSFVEMENFFHEFDAGFTKRQVDGHFSIVEDPVRTFSVLEPGDVGGCNKSVRATVAESAKQRKCYVATNAGYFRTKNGHCLGNIVSDGRMVQDAGGIQNANFGIRKDGTIVTGYLSNELITDQVNPILQLVTGVVWLLRRGQVYVDVSKKVECQDLEETGSVDLFVNVLSGRTAIGHDASGRVVLVQVDGRTHHRGMNLYDFARLLKKFGLVNAINLDGGGSTTTVVNGTLVNYPSDGCGQFTCPRKVSTIACFHEPDCQPRDCNGHGVCRIGRCVCDRYWIGPACDLLECQNANCSMNGLCSDGGCACFAGWSGNDCSKGCPSRMFGVNCSQQCLCNNGGSCNSITGQCTCPPGWMGSLCELACHPGTFGTKCSKLCNCTNSCQCDPVTGDCPSGKATSPSTFQNSTKHWMLCVAKAQGTSIPATMSYDYSVKENDMQHEYRKLFIWFLGVISLCGVSILANLILIYLQCNTATTRRPYKTRRLEEAEFLFVPDEEL